MMEEEDDEMMDEDEDDYMMEEDNSEGEDMEEPKLKHQTTQQIGHEYEYELQNPNETLNALMSKVKKLENQLDGMIESCEWGFFWNLLRKNRFMLDDSIAKVQDQIDVAMSRPVNPLPADKKTFLCEIDEMEYEPHEIAHLGCGHYFCKYNYENYIKELISKGPSCIEARCPHHDESNPKSRC